MDETLRRQIDGGRVILKTQIVENGYEYWIPLDSDSMMTLS